MDFYAVLDHTLDLLRQRGRVTYRALKLQIPPDLVVKLQAIDIIEVFV